MDDDQIAGFRGFRTSPGIIRLAVKFYVRIPLSLRNVEDRLHERGIHVSHETIRFRWHGFGPIIATEIRCSWAEYCSAVHRPTACAPPVIGAGIRTGCS